MLDINKLRNAYNVIHRMSQNRHPFAEEELTDAAEVIAVYGKIMNLVSQSTSFGVGGSKIQKESFNVTAEELVYLKPVEMPLKISDIAKSINENIPAIAKEKMNKVTAPGLGRWLMNLGYLQMSDNGKNKIATEKGAELGIHTEKRESQHAGDGYYVNYYSQAAQQFIFDNLPAVAEFLAKEKEEKLADA